MKPPPQNAPSEQHGDGLPPRHRRHRRRIIRFRDSNTCLKRATKQPSRIKQPSQITYAVPNSDCARRYSKSIDRPNPASPPIHSQPPPSQLCAAKSKESATILQVIRQTTCKNGPPPSRLESRSAPTTSLFGWNTFRPTSKRKAVVVPTTAFFVLSRYFARTCVNAAGRRFSVV